MKTFTAGLAIGVLIGFYVTSGQCRDKLAAIKTQQEEAQIELALAYSKTAEVWRDRLDAVNAEPAPAPAPERVYVKADCVRSGGASGLGDGADTDRYRLADATVQSVARVAQDFEAAYRECSHRLAFFQEAFKGQ